MLNRTIQSVFRASRPMVAEFDATRRFAYDNPTKRNHKNKMAAKERRRIARAAKSNENKTPADLGEELPPFMIPARYKLLFKFL